MVEIITTLFGTLLIVVAIMAFAAGYMRGRVRNERERLRDLDNNLDCRHLTSRSNNEKEKAS